MLTPTLRRVAGLLEPSQRLVEFGDDDRKVPDRRDHRILPWHQVNLGALPFDPGVLPQRLRRLDPLKPEQLEKARGRLDVRWRNLYADMVEHVSECFCLLRLKPWRQ